ncbi:hypothetical protein E3P86_01481 [Wallemia ichthyophaga]|uniref:Uncharacterized protein n=1 Tax=Wallemia ichthyophaga TaxID=245174 RepID=A0A4T0JEF0_WALIC|nr:hypothetical protein E3P86_01481 [Wallemia ichthyophaga]
MWSDLTLKASYSAMRRRMRERYTAPLKVEASIISDINANAAKSISWKADSSKRKTARGISPTTKSYLFRFRLIDSPKCSARGTKDTISHRIFICKRHNGQNHIKKKDYQDRHSVHLKSNTQKRTLSTSPLRVLQTAIDYIPKILR